MLSVNYVCRASFRWALQGTGVRLTDSHDINSKADASTPSVHFQSVFFVSLDENIHV